MKKILLSLIIFLSSISFVYANNDFSSPGFMFSVKEFFWIWKDVISWSDLETKSNNLFAEIINILIVGMWVIALFVMVVGAWFMIFYNWQDEVLNKWKKMFMTGIIWLFLALSSYYIVALIKYFIYQ